MELWQSYHSHKENMANAGFLVQMSLFTAITTKTIWPPEWINKIIHAPEYYTFAIYFLFWYLIHYYMRWQLINKRIAAIYVSGFERAYKKLVTTKKTEILELKPYRGPDYTQTPYWKKFLASLIYLPDGFIKMDATVRGLPTFLAKEIIDQIRQGSGSATLEILMTYSSILMMIIVFVKTFFGN